MLFANFAEAVAEGRGKAQAECAAPHENRNDGAACVVDGDVEERVTSTQSAQGRRVRRRGGRDRSRPTATSLEGAATVDESAITGESAPVIREAGGDRSAVTGGTRVLSDRIVVRVRRQPGRELPRPHDSLVEGAQRQKTPNEIALSILLAGLTIIF